MIRNEFLCEFSMPPQSMVDELVDVVYKKLGIKSLDAINHPDSYERFKHYNGSEEDFDSNYAPEGNFILLKIRVGHTRFYKYYRYFLQEHGNCYFYIHYPKCKMVPHLDVRRQASFSIPVVAQPKCKTAWYEAEKITDSNWINNQPTVGPSNVTYIEVLPGKKLFSYALQPDKACVYNTQIAHDVQYENSEDTDTPRISFNAHIRTDITWDDIIDKYSQYYYTD